MLAHDSNPPDFNPDEVKTLGQDDEILKLKIALNDGYTTLKLSDETLYESIKTLRNIVCDLSAVGVYEHCSSTIETIENLIVELAMLRSCTQQILPETRKAIHSTP